MGSKSVRKGSAFERRIAKIFAEVYNCKIVRTPLSGGWGHMHTKGDLVADDDKWPWFVECKYEQGWTLWSAAFDGRGPIKGWWLKAVEQAKIEGKQPLLVLGQANQPPLVVFGVSSQLYLELLTPCMILAMVEGDDPPFNYILIAAARLDKFLSSVVPR
jgi:hypothetical protein